jgi:predicted nucleotidyltransferase
MRHIDELTLNNDDRRAVEAAVRLLKQRFPVEQVILYGSKARGTDDAESDIDLLVLTREPMSWRQQREVIAALHPLELEYDVVLSPLVVSRQEWEEGIYRVLPIHDEVARDGVAA